ncbi:MAG: SDR family oxidoreductase [Terracidiphilus sp.]|nr:SDR family oxidoreductase [Terracidiphilus sp.]MDR3776914.1 SDR family oxidoreductase [Terracidiphilus sp.]
MMKIIVVTGASSGFGRMAAQELAMAGHTVYAGIRETTGRNAPQVAALDAFAAENGVDLHAIEMDVISQKSVDAAIEKVLSEQRRIDVIVHNAGHMTFGPSEAFTVEQLAENYDVNVLSAQRVNRAVLPIMRRQRNGLLVWVSSSSAKGGTPPYLGPYFAAKAAMDSLAVSYAGELARWGIGTTIIVPGAFTKGTNHFTHATSPQDATRAEEYAKGPTVSLSETALKGLAALEPEDADPTEVARAIVRIVDTPERKRSFRVHIDPSQDGAEIANAVSDRMRSELLRRIGLEDLLGLSGGVSVQQQ